MAPLDYSQERGHPEQFYKLTPDGFKVAINDLIPKESTWEHITPEQFWKYLFENMGDKSSEQIYEFCDLYLEKILHVKRDHLLPQVFFFFFHRESDKWDKKPRGDRYMEKSIKPILTTLSKHKPMNQEQILKRLPMNNKSDIEYLHHYGLIFKSTKGTYDITHSGLIELFFYLYRDSNIDPSISYQEVESLKDPSAKKIKKEFERIRKKYHDLLPDIFNDNKFSRLGINVYEIVTLLMILYRDLPDIIYERDNPHNEEFQTLQRFDKTRQESYSRKILQFLRIDEVITTNVEVSENNALQVYFSLSHAFLGEQQELLEEPPEEIQEEVYNNTAWTNQIRNKITFDFYSIYKVYDSDWSTNSLEKLGIREWHDKGIRTLLTFTEEHSKYIKSHLGKEYD